LNYAILLAVNSLLYNKELVVLLIKIGPGKEIYNEPEFAILYPKLRL
jgi:hypothetical protein